MKESTILNGFANLEKRGSIYESGGVYMIHEDEVPPMDGEFINIIENNISIENGGVEIEIMDLPPEINEVPLVQPVQTE